MARRDSSLTGRYVGVDEFIDTKFNADGRKVLTLVACSIWMGGDGPLVESADGSFGFPFRKGETCAYRISGEERRTDFPLTELRHRWAYLALTTGEGQSELWVNGRSVDAWDSAPELRLDSPLLLMRNATGFVGLFAAFGQLSNDDLDSLWEVVKERPNDGPELTMPRGARVDLAASELALERLLAVYVRDLQAGELSDEAIEAVNSVIRSLQGSLEKIANEINERFCKPKAKKPYFPIADDPGKFNGYLKKNLPGLRAMHPEIAAAIERQQPYHPDKRQLARLKPLYRENHHHGFTVQKVQRSVSWEQTVDGKVVGAAHSRILDISPAAQLFYGVPVAKRRGTEGRSMTEWVDWSFSDLDVSVFGTLRILHNLCVKACFEVWDSTDL